MLDKAIMATMNHPTIGQKVKNHWIQSNMLYDAIVAMAVISPHLDFKASSFNRLFSKSQIFRDCERFDGSNMSGIFKVIYSKKTYLYITEQGSQVSYPLVCPEFAKEAHELKLATSFRSGRSNLVPTAATAEAINLHRAKNKNSRPTNDYIDLVESPRTKKQKIQDQTFWQSPEAVALFHPKSIDEMSVVNTLQRRIRILKAAQKHDQWRLVCQGHDPDNICSDFDKVALRQKSLCLLQAYQIALTKMPETTWLACCKEATTILNALGIDIANSGKTVATYNRVFRTNEVFLHPNLAARTGKNPLPPLLDAYPIAKEMMQMYTKTNLLGLTVDMVFEHVQKHILPRVYAIWLSEQPSSHDKDDHSYTSFLKAHRLFKFTPQTALNWMKRLGMRYDTNKKTYYVDGHERTDVIQSRKEFCKRYLDEYEPRCLRWIQLPEDVAKQNNLDGAFGHHYTTADNTPMVEYHEEYVLSRPDLSLDTVSTMSVRVAEATRPLEIVGQDECVFMQYLLGGRNWVGSNGERPLLPKTDGDGKMISAFQSRLLGFGRPMTAEELAAVNLYRCGKTYWDTEAALEVHKQTAKQPLRESPFLRSIVVGANNDGYWNSMHMSIQFEDCVDCCKTLYNNDWLFLFDHSQGHNRKRKGALDARTMNMSWGGAQPKLRSTQIVEANGFLGPFNPMLGVGDIQEMVWPSEVLSPETGPFYLSDEEKVARRVDYATGKTEEKKKTKARLKQELEAKGILFTMKRNHTFKELAELATANQIELKESVDKVCQGWLGQPKGLLQVARERGLIDPNNLSYYTITGRKGVNGAIDESSSLRQILTNCTDFRNELTHLQVMAEALGVKVDFTPKFHAEMAGEGVEYSWAYAKGNYRRKPLSKKRTRAGFVQLVDECLDPKTELTKERVRRFSARARSYICTYHYLSNKEVTVDEEKSNEPLLLDDIERLTKKFRTHRCAMDFDRGFLEGSPEK